MTLIEFALLKGDYAKNEAGEQFFLHRDWRLTPDRVVAIYLRQDHEGEIYYYPFDRFATDRIGDMDTSVPQVVLGQGAIYIFDDLGLLIGEVVVVSVMA
ncbi:MAG: hypothetical protein VX293_10050 [Candidatus Latescibacterota bacterium]|nr:hypothetical protein [Candidatus Latescibacterota bacterium]